MESLLLSNYHPSCQPRNLIMYNTPSYILAQFQILYDVIKSEKKEQQKTTKKKKTQTFVTSSSLSELMIELFFFI